MKKVLILVEGQTEESFVSKVLAPALEAVNVTTIPTVVVTKVVRGHASHKGGFPAYEKVRKDLQRLLKDSSAALVTTMFDYYALPSTSPGMATRPALPSLDRARHVEAALQADLNHARFRAYLSIHEFEATLFADLAQCPFLDSRAMRTLAAARAAVPTPEHINDSPSTAPSKRILAAFPDYQKVLHGVQGTQAIGLPKLRAECPHFGDWVAALEAA